MSELFLNKGLWPIFIQHSMKHSISQISIKFPSIRKKIKFRELLINFIFTLWYWQKFTMTGRHTPGDGFFSSSFALINSGTIRVSVVYILFVFTVFPEEPLNNTKFLFLWMIITHRME